MQQKRAQPNEFYGNEGLAIWPVGLVVRGGRRRIIENRRNKDEEGFEAYRD